MFEDIVHARQIVKPDMPRRIDLDRFHVDEVRRPFAPGQALQDFFADDQAAHLRMPCRGGGKHHHVGFVVALHEQIMGAELPLEDIANGIVHLVLQFLPTVAQLGAAFIEVDHEDVVGQVARAPSENAFQTALEIVEFNGLPGGSFGTLRLFRP